LSRAILAPKLRASGQVERLLRLFEDDHWLHRQVTPESRDWSGYLRDLDLAWDALAERDADPADLPAFVRLALIRCTVKTVDSVPPALLVAAVRTGVWSGDRALSVAGRFSTADDRAEAYAGLLDLPDLDAGLRQTTRARLIQLADLDPDEVPARVLINAMRHLGPVGRTAVADRLCERPRVATDRAWRVGTDRQRTVAAEDLLEALLAFPEIRRTELVSVAMDGLTEAIETSLAADHSTPRRADSGESLQKQRMAEMAEVVALGLGATEDLCRDLCGYAPLLDLHGSPEELLRRVSGILSGIHDRQLHESMVAAFQRAAAGSGRTWISPTTVPDEPDADAVNRARRLRLTRMMVERMRKLPPTWPEREAASRPEELEDLVVEWTGLARPFTGFAEVRPLTESPPGSAVRAVRRNRKRDRVQFAGHLSAISEPAVMAFGAGVVVEGGIAPDDALRWLDDNAHIEHPVESFYVCGTFLDQEDRPDVRTMLRRMQGLILRDMLRRAYHGYDLLGAWSGLDASDIHDVDLDPVVDYILELPAERPEGGYLPIGFRAPALWNHIPRLTAMAVVRDHSSSKQMARLVADVARLPDIEVRRLGIELAAPRLDADGVLSALAALNVPRDATEQVWAFTELARLVTDQPEQDRLHRWATASAALVGDGLDFAESVVSRLHDHLADVSTGVGAFCLAAIRSMDTVNRTNALRVLGQHPDSSVSAVLLPAVFDLPVTNELRNHSYRAEALHAVHSAMPDEYLPAAWAAAQDIPHELMGTMDAAAWGYDWETQYPYAAVVRDLAPRLTGSMAREAFDAAVRMPWMCREEIVRGLASHASGELARDIFDFSMRTHQTYPDAVRSADTTHHLVENEAVFGPIEDFFGMREVHLAETIAAMAPRLDPRRLARAAAQAVSFTNPGPLAWLPGRLLPHLPADQREPMLSSAIVHAIEFVTAQPDRLDMLIDLMPFAEEEITHRQERLDRFVADRFGHHRGPLTATQIATLGRADRRTYDELRGVNQAIRHLAESKKAPDEDTVRAAMIRHLLTPTFAPMIPEVVIRAVLVAPLDVSCRVLDELRQVLAPEAHARVVQDLLDEVLRGGVPPGELVSTLGQMLAHLTEPQLDRVLDTLASLDGPTTDASTVTAALVRRLFAQYGRSVLHADPRFGNERHFPLWQSWLDENHSDDFESTLHAGAGNRARVLALLAPRLPAAGLTRATALLATMTEVERAFALPEILKALPADQRKQLAGTIAGFRDPDARFLALFMSQSTLGDENLASYTHLAWHTALALPEPRHRIGSLEMLVGYFETARSEWSAYLLEHIRMLGDTDALSALAVLCHVEADPDGIMEAVTRLSTDDTRFAGFLIMARQGLELARRSDHDGLLRAAQHRLLAGADRPALLASLARDAPAYAALAGPDVIPSVAEVIHDVCADWRLP
jgi:hypothetical protein